MGGCDRIIRVLVGETDLPEFREEIFVVADVPAVAVIGVCRRCDADYDNGACHCQ
jgi:hypothetical protein